MPNKKISELNENLSPSGDNIIPIVASGNTDFISLSGLTNFVLSGVSSGSNYKVYTALLTQTYDPDAPTSPTNGPPVATILENTINANIFWSRNAIGSYQMNFDSVDPFFIIDYNKVPMPKGICSTSPGVNVFSVNVYSFVSNDANSILLDTASYDSMSGAYVYSDNLLQSSLIEIRIYN